MAIDYSMSIVSTSSCNKVYTQAIINGYTLTLAYVPEVIINGQGIELHGLSQIVPRASTAIASNTAYFGDFCTEPDRKAVNIKRHGPGG